jgi:glycosyltransferase involved in cell wall biosynthesis
MPRKWLAKPRNHPLDDRSKVAETREEVINLRPADSPFLSVVVPARNEAASLPQLVEEITRALRALCNRSPDLKPIRPTGFEIIIVDDGSTDLTACVLDDLAVTFAELRPLRLMANGGQSTALTAGFHAARGEWIATLDADLQNDPGDLPRLWNALTGHDVALGWRVNRKDTWSRRLISWLANRVRNTVLRQSIQDTGCSLRIFRRDHALRLPLFQGMHRFLGPLLLQQDYRVIQIPVNHRPRIHGRSHYNLRNRSIRVVIDLLGVAWLMRRPLSYQILEPTSPRLSDCLDTGMCRSRQSQRTVLNHRAIAPATTQEHV